MWKKLLSAIILFVLLASCSNGSKPEKLESAGLLVPDTISDQVWGTKGYKGMLKIQSEFGVDVFYKEGITTKAMTERAVKDFKSEKVNLIFGHGNEYADYFHQIAEKYLDIHFVSFNGDAQLPNTTSLRFEGHAMGFFGGMVAAHMSKNKKIGVIAAYEWQPEVKGFVEGAAVQDPEIEVMMEYTNNWDDAETAIEKLEQLILKGADVIYPAGDGFNVPVIERIKEKGLFAIGYVSDQSDLGESTVLTSTVQEVDKLYELVAKKHAQGTLKSGNLNFDFQDGVISMGTFSPLIDKNFQIEIEKSVTKYIETGKLPTEPLQGQVK